MKKFQKIKSVPKSKSGGGSQSDLFSLITLPTFPSTRYQGSKRKVLGELAAAFQLLNFKTALDLFSGSGSVSLLLRYLGKAVDANDFQLFNANTADLFLSIDNTHKFECREQLEALINSEPMSNNRLVERSYSGVFFKDHENAEIDRFCQNIQLSPIPDIEKKLYRYAVGQALMKKRPYNLFHRANLAMRTKEVKRSFGNAVTWEGSIIDHALKAICELQKFPFEKSTGSHRIFSQNTSDLSTFPDDYDLIYLDPPYLNSRGIGVDYSDFYSFLEGVCDYKLFGCGSEDYPHKPINKKASRWLNADSALDELKEICLKWPRSIIFMSYRSDGMPTPDEVRSALSINGRTVEMHSCGEYKYALSTTSTNEEIFLISFPSSTKEKYI